MHKCAARSAFGMESINFERVLSYNPEVILVYERDFYSQIYSDPKWRHIDAVKNRRVYLLPKGSFSWFDRPPSFMKIMGLQWLMNVLHSEHYPLDLNTETKRFYKLFLQLDLNELDLKVILGDR